MSPRSHAITAIDGSALAPESIRMLDYLKTRSMELSASAIRERIRAGELLHGQDRGCGPAKTRRRPYGAADLLRRAWMEGVCAVAAASSSRSPHAGEEFARRLPVAALVTEDYWAP